MGWPQGVYRVGPLGRLNVSKQLDTPLANAELKIFRAFNPGKPVENTLLYPLCSFDRSSIRREKVRDLLDDPDILRNDILNTHREFKGEGVGVIEAPRGTLIHHYWTDANGPVKEAST